MTKKTPAKYNVGMVEAVILLEAAERESQNLTAGELAREIISDPEDSRQVEIVFHGIRNLKEVGLFSNPGGEVVKLTPAGRHAYELMQNQA
jgi:hypothetical protein